MPAVVYEREPGAASQPVPGRYRRREPEKTVIYRVVQHNLEDLLQEAAARSDSGAGYPAFIEHEFRRYLGCGQLSGGFARLRCPDCGHERLVAFSCKGRLCGSCSARRAADTAAHLVDRVFPEAPYRHWVLTFPREVGFLLSVDRAFMTKMLGAYLRTLFAWQRRRGRQLGVQDGQIGAVTFVQRFNSALGLFPHLHSLVRYHGLFANRSRYRAMLPPPPADPDQTADDTQPSISTASTPEQPSCGQDIGPPIGPPLDAEPRRPRRLRWAQLLRRVLHVDALTCPQCLTPMVVLAFLTDPAVVRRILDHLGLPTSAPRPTSARLSLQEELCLVDQPLLEQAFVDVATMAQYRAIRGPP